MEEGVKIDAYQLVKKIGAGGFSEVWEVKNEEGRVFAMKIVDILNPALQGNKDIIDSEFHKSRDLIHPNLLLPRSSGVFNERYKYLVLPLCKGSLMEELQRRKSEAKDLNLVEQPIFSEQELAKILHDVADALAYLKKQGIVHKDIKPDNVMLYTKGDQVEYMISDFGISEKHPVSKLSRETILLDSRNRGLSKAYASPEYFRNQIHTNSDIFSLGVMLYELVIGETPYENESGSIGEILSNESDLIELADNISIAGILKRIIANCLRYKPEDRPSAENLAEWADFYLTNHRWNPINFDKSNDRETSRKIYIKSIALFSVLILTLGLIDYILHDNKLKESILYLERGDVEMAEIKAAEARAFFIPLYGLKRQVSTLIQIKSKFTRIMPYQSGLAIAKTNGDLYTLIDMDGVEKISHPVKGISYLDDGVYMLLLDSSKKHCIAVRTVDVKGDRPTVWNVDGKDSSSIDFQFRTVLRNIDGSIEAIGCDNKNFKFKNI